MTSATDRTTQQEAVGQIPNGDGAGRAGAAGEAPTATGAAGTATATGAPAPPTDAPMTRAPAGPASEPGVAPGHGRPMGPEAPVGAAGPVAVGVPKVRVTRMMIVGLLTLFAGAWAGIVPFIGPSFGFSADATPAWTWNLSHALLNLAAGGAAVLAALWMLGAVPELAYDRRRPLMALAGLLAIASGAWLVIGPSTWPVLEGHGYFYASGWGLMMRQIGYSFGPGLVIAVLGAYALGWAGHNGASVGRRHRDVAAAESRTVEPRTVEPRTATTV